MFTIKDTMFVQDLFKLTKPKLKEIATNLDIDSTLNKNELVIRINEKKDELTTTATKVIEESILATKSTAITWFKFDPKLTHDEFKDLVIENTAFNPFEETNQYDENNLTTEPTLLVASSREDQTGVYLRFIYKSGVRYETTPTSIRPVSRATISTVYYDVEMGILEVRGDTKKSLEIARTVAQMLNLQVTMEPVETPFNQEIGSIADQLGGKLIETTSKPEIYFEEFSEDELNSVFGVLHTLDEYMQTKDSSALEVQLQAVSDSFGQGEAMVPFAALVLSGLETVGVASSSEIRTLPLFSYLEPHLQHQGGFIKFPYTIRNVEETFTIRIGMNTNSVVFVSQVTEEIIDFVRRNVII
ncbi:hypothetical protein [Psychrobacillus sp. FSL H8-0487]|uniref:hypothetical protein n=1 Tax=Psychrobacillus sp. FSL H8-0487 TaxID=2921391 RepID=UPI0030F56BDA